MCCTGSHSAAWRTHHTLTDNVPNNYLVAFLAQDDDFDMFTGGCFDNDAFAWTAGEYGHQSQLAQETLILSENCADVHSSIGCGSCHH
jgi:hypothetical protein